MMFKEITLALAVKRHHNPVESDGNHLAYVVYRSNIITRQLVAGEGVEFSTQISREVMAFLGLGLI